VGDVDDVRMVELGRRLGLALEAARDLFQPPELGVQELERQLLFEHHVLDAIHGAHPAAAERRDHPVAVRHDAADERVALRRGLRSVDGHGPYYDTVNAACDRWNARLFPSPICPRPCPWRGPASPLRASPSR